MFSLLVSDRACGANSLPRIIGGSDLVAHNAANRKDLDDWLKEAIHVSIMSRIKT